MKTFIGMKINNFTVIGDEYNTSKNVLVPIQCSCGYTTDMPRWVLLNKPPSLCKECRKVQIQSNIDHIKNKLKDLYTKIKQRIENPTGKNSCYINVKMSKDWYNDFNIFYEWAIDNNYKEGLSIDRINPDGDYCEDNCRWATSIEQSQNRRKTKNNTTGYKGVYKSKPRNGKVIYQNTFNNPYYTIIIYDGKRTTLSGFSTAEEAYEARLLYIKQNYDGLVIPQSTQYTTFQRPSGSKYGKIIKNCFVAPEGWLFAGADFSALEDKIGAILSKDKNKTLEFAQSFDGHSLRALAFFPEELPEGLRIDSKEDNSLIKKEYGDIRAKSKGPSSNVGDVVQ